VTETAPQRPTWLVWLLLGVMLLGLPVLGLLGGFRVAEAAVSGALTRWQRLPDPPQPAAEILAAGSRMGNDAWWIYVRSAAGETYACSPAEEGACWVTVPEPVELPTMPPCEYPSNYTVPAPPGRVIARLDTEACNFEAGYQVNFAVLENGSVWRWEHFSSGLSGVAGWLFGGLCGAGLGVLVAVTLTTIVLIRRRGK
jgi:hypothetical protein